MYIAFGRRIETYVFLQYYIIVQKEYTKRQKKKDC